MHLYAHNNVGMAIKRTGDFKGSIEYFRKAIQIDPQLSLNYLVVAMIQAEIGRLSEARDAVIRLLEIDPDFSIGAFSEGTPFRDESIEARRQVALRESGLLR